MKENSLLLLKDMALNKFRNLERQQITYLVEELYSYYPQGSVEISKYFNAVAKKSNLPSRFFFWLEANYLNLELAMKGGDDSDEEL